MVDLLIVKIISIKKLITKTFRVLNINFEELELLAIMQRIAEGTAGSKEDCAEMIRILIDQNFNSMIPFYLPKEVIFAHKTGSITGVHHDSGIVYLPDGCSYVLVILSKNLKDFDGATVEMSVISKKVYDFMMR